MEQKLEVWMKEHAPVVDAARRKAGIAKDVTMNEKKQEAAETKPEE